MPLNVASHQALHCFIKSLQSDNVPLYEFLVHKEIQGIFCVKLLI